MYDKTHSFEVYYSLSFDLYTNVCTCITIIIQDKDHVHDGKSSLFPVTVSPTLHPYPRQPLICFLML